MPPACFACRCFSLSRTTAMRFPCRLKRRPMPGGSISQLAWPAFPGLFRPWRWTMAPTFSRASLRDAGSGGVLPRRARSDTGAHARCIRPYSHSLSDDERLYKTTGERNAEAESERDPVLLFPKLLIDEGVMDRQMLQRTSRTKSTRRISAGDTQQAMHDETPAAPGSGSLQAPVFGDGGSNLGIEEVRSASRIFTARP